MRGRRQNPRTDAVRGERGRLLEGGRPRLEYQRSPREQGAHNRHSPEAWRVLGKEQPQGILKEAVYACNAECEHLKFLLEGRARTVFLLF